jgi:hypothetical protein
MALAAYLSALVTYYFPGAPGTATVTFIGAIAGIVIVYLSTQTSPTAAGAAVLVGLTRRDIGITAVFTTVELVTLTAWGALIGVPFAFSAGAAVILLIGLSIEHLVSRLKG